MPAADAVGFAALFESHEARRSMTERRNFAQSKYSMEIPFLLEVQVESFNRFLQIGTLPRERADEGLEAVFRETFPISDVKGNYELVYDGYSLGVPKYSIPECQERGMTRGDCQNRSLAGQARAEPHPIAPCKTTP